MNILIVFDSFFGNTEKIAKAIGAALQSTHDVTVVRADIASEQLVQKADAVIVGSPTLRWQATEATMEFLKNLPEGCLQGRRTAAFDTRILAYMDIFRAMQRLREITEAKLYEKYTTDKPKVT
jgi:flavodoxin